jgi:crossover junction endodeoxyribonuclease RusA
MQTITLTLPYPISANRYWASRVIKHASGKQMALTYVTAEAKAYKAQVIALARAAGVIAPITGRVQLDIRLYPHRPLDFQKRMRAAGAAWDDMVMCIDLDNANKVLLDSIKDLVIEDDKWVRRLSAERMEPDGEARVVVTITALATEQPQLGLALPATPQPVIEQPLPF